MPNWNYLALHFFHTLALALWVGGIVGIGIIVAPVAFGEAPDRNVAGRIVGRSLSRFDLVVAGCIVALTVTSLLMIVWYGRWSPWYAVEYACIVLMSGSALYSMLILSPRMRRLRSRTPTGGQVRAADSESFDRLHRTAVLTMQFNLACGTIAILFS